MVRTGTAWVIAVVCLVAVAAGCGSSSDDNGSLDADAVARGYRAFTLQLSDRPSLNAVLTLELSATGELSSVQWRLSERPAEASAALSVGSPEEATIIPDALGEYKVTIEALVDGVEAASEFNFIVRADFPFDEFELDRDDPSAPLDEVIGIVRNQLYVFSLTLSEDAIIDLAQTVTGLSIVGYDEARGLLVEVDDPVAAASNLRSLPGVDSVHNRVHQGPNADRSLRTPDDGSSFSDGGDNWHLEHINAPQAWDATTGSEEFFIGVKDAGFFSSHEDLVGRFGTIDRGTDSHGTAVASAIAAVTDNGRGISGVNWTTKLIASTVDIDTVLDTRIAGKRALVVNNAWLMPAKPRSDLDRNNDTMLSARRALALTETRDFRNAALRKYRDRLFVWAIGNGLRARDPANDGGLPSELQNGAIHIHDGGELARLDNVITVAAVVSDGRLTAFSDFGPTVEIAAPTRFKTARRGTNEYFETEFDYGLNDNGITGGFGGTSASSAVVTGAASLLLSINPALSPATVKRVLIQSADRSATQRYTKVDAGSGASDENLQSLSEPVPILNLAEAVRTVEQVFMVTIRSDPHFFYGRTNEPIFFSADVINGEPPYLYEWDFDDGGSSVLRSDTHEFTSQRNYNVRVKVTDANDVVVFSNTLPMRVTGDAAPGFGHPTKDICPPSIQAVSVPGEPPTTTFTFSEFLGREEFFEARCIYRTNDPDAVLTGHSPRLHYQDTPGNALGCGRSENYFSGSTGYSWIRKLRADTGSFSASSFADAEGLLGQILDNAASAGVGAPCP